MRLFAILILLAAAFLLALVVYAAAQPSCEEQGGRLVRDGTRLILVGKVMVHAPAYRCEAKP
jgi:hypothetical protein